MFAVCLLCAMRGTLCLTPVMGCAHMDHHRACRVTSVQTTTERTENKCSASVACGWCVAQTLLLTRGPTLPPWRLSALWEVSDQHFQKTVRTHPLRSTFAGGSRSPSSKKLAVAKLSPRTGTETCSDLRTKTANALGLKAIANEIEKQLAHHANLTTNLHCAAHAENYANCVNC